MNILVRSKENNGIDLPEIESYKQGGGTIYYKKNDNLRSEGVKFILSDLHKEEIIKCKKDPIYFLENYVKIRHPSRGRIPFILYEPQKELIKLYNSDLKDHRNIISKIGRQLGKTEITAGFFTWYTIFHKDKTIGIAAHQLDGAKQVLMRVKDMYETIPTWLQQGIKKWDATTIILENGCTILTAATTGGGFRGKSISILYIDEMAFIPSNICNDFMTATIPVVAAGNTTKVFITSTPQGYNAFYTYWTGAECITNPDREGWNGFTPFSYDYTRVPDRDEEWVIDIRRKLGSEVKFNQEVLCKFLGSSSTLISGEMLEQIKSETIHLRPLKMETRDEKYDNSSSSAESDLSVYKWWEYPQNGYAYMACIDVAEGIGGDYSIINMIDISHTPYRTVFTFRSNKITPQNFATVIEAICKEYNEAFIFIEENSAKEIPYILKREVGYPNLIHTRTGRFGVYATHNYGRRDVVGVKINKKIKETGCMKLKMLIEERKLIVYDKDIFLELASFIMKGNGVFSADDGANDDLVSTMVLFAWMTTQDIFKDLCSEVSAYDANRLRYEYARDKMVPMAWAGHATDYEDNSGEDEQAKFWKHMRTQHDALGDDGSGFTELLDDLGAFYGY